MQVLEKLRKAETLHDIKRKYDIDDSIIEVIMQPVYLLGDEITKLLLIFHMVVTIVLSVYYDTYLVGIGGMILASGAFFICVKIYPARYITRCIAGLSLSVFVILHIYQMRGLDEMHFWFFTAQTIMLVYQDWKAMWPGILLSVFHYSLFAYLTNTGYDMRFSDSHITATQFIWHFIVLISQVTICNYWAVLLKRQTAKDALQNIELTNKTDELNSVLNTLRSDSEKAKNENSEKLKLTNEDLHNTLIQLKSTQEIVQKQDKLASLGELVAGVAHEINTPIGISVTASSHLSNATEKFIEDIKNPQINKSALLSGYVKMADESTKLILRNLSRASELITSFKKVAVNQSSEDLIQFDLRSVTEDVISSVHPTIKKANITVQNDIPENILMTSYPGALGQIYINFVNNACIYAFTPEKNGGIIITASQEGNKVIINFSDNGIGMPPDVLSRIFDPFFTTGRSMGGSGLGLNIVFNLITQKLGGTIEAKSEVGIGTTFKITLPLELNK